MTNRDETRPAKTQDESSEASPLEAKELLTLLRRDLRYIEKELSTLNAESGAPLTKNVATAATELRDAVGGFLEKAETVTSEVGHEAAVQTGRAREQIERHPMAAVSSAFALGYFLGRTVFRKAHHDPHP